MRRHIQVALRALAQASPVPRALVLTALVVAVPAASFAAQRLATPTPPMPGRIVYSRAQQAVWDLYLSDPNGANEAQLTNTNDVDIGRSAAAEAQQRWSPDGRQIAFTTFDRTGERATIWQVPFTGGTPTPFVENDAGFGEPAWQRPNTGCITFSGARAGGVDRATDLMIKCPGQPSRVLVNTADLDEGGSDWKPDGSQIVYEARATGLSGAENKPWDLWTVNADGSDRRLLLDEPDTAERSARWSPDGATIAYLSFKNKSGVGRGILKTLDLSNNEVSAHVEGAAGTLAWSPDGSHILFYNTWDGGPKPLAASAPAQDQVRGLYMLDPETHEITRLLPPAGGEGAVFDRFEWGYAPDWTAGTVTPTSVATSTPTATATVSASNTPTPTNTPDEPTPTVRPTDVPSPDIYLPISYKP